MRHPDPEPRWSLLPHARGRSRPFSLIYAPHRRLSAAARALIDMFTAGELA